MNRLLARLMLSRNLALSIKKHTQHMQAVTVKGLSI